MVTEFTWYGHATLGLETDGYKVLIDPFFSGNPVASATADEEIIVASKVVKRIYFKIIFRYLINLSK